MTKLIELYSEKVGWQELATRYLANLCGGRWLWNNKRHAYRINIELTPWPWSDDNVLFRDIRKNYFDTSCFRDHPHWEDLVELVSEAFSKRNGLAVMEVSASLRLPTSAAIYPSQAFTENRKGENGKGENNRQYQYTEIEGKKSPIIGCFKVGAAIATIDDWYPEAEKPIRISHYGVDKQNITCYRHPDTKKDFFSMLKNIDHYVEILSSKNEYQEEFINDLHYIVANLIKGGLFQR